MLERNFVTISGPGKIVGVIPAKVANVGGAGESERIYAVIASRVQKLYQHKNNENLGKYILSVSTLS